MSDLPFNTDPKFEISRVLNTRHEIPYHSRPFMWSRNTYIELVVKKSLQKFRQKRQHWLGYMIIYDDKLNIPAISDAQHRTTVYFLMNVALAAILKSVTPLKQISQYGDDDELGLDVTDSDAETLNRYGWGRYPNIRSRYDYDFEALGNILNSKGRDSDSVSNLYDAYDVVVDILRGALASTEDAKGFFRFINKDTFISRMIIYDWDFAIEVFADMNNIKFSVPPVYLLKNEIVKRIGIDRSEDVHSQFQEWETACGVSFQQIVHYATDMIRRRITGREEYNRDITATFDDVGAGVCPFALFQRTVGRILHIQALIRSDRFGSILERMMNGHEIFHHCILPIFYFAVDDKEALPLLRKLIAFGLRWEKRFTFNPMKIQETLIGSKGIITRFLQEGTRSSSKEIIQQLVEQFRQWLGDASPITERIYGETYKSAKQFGMARCALLYLVEVTDCHESQLDHSKVDIDHISPLKPRAAEEGLAQKENIHRIGNFTPFVKGVSDSGLRGNRSVKNMPYSEKKEFYKSSNIAMTRDVVARWPESFRDAEILQRTLNLAREIEKISAADLYH